MMTKLFPFSILIITLISTTLHARYSEQNYTAEAERIITSNTFEDRNGEIRKLNLEDADIIMSRGVEWLARFCLYGDHTINNAAESAANSSFCNSFLQHTVNFAIVANESARNTFSNLPAAPVTSGDSSKISNTQPLKD